MKSACSPSVPASWCSWALVSCMHSRSASWVANQSKKPLRTAERTPLALKLMMRMGEEPGLGIGDWGLGMGDWGWGLGGGGWGIGERGLVNRVGGTCESVFRRRKIGRGHGAGQD